MQRAVKVLRQGAPWPCERHPARECYQVVGESEHTGRRGCRRCLAALCGGDVAVDAERAADWETEEVYRATD